MKPKELCLLCELVPLLSFFYTKDAPEYKEYKLKEGEFDEAKHQWHEENNTYGFSHGLGILIMGIGILTFLGIFSPKIGLVGAGLAIVMTLGTLSFLVTTPEVWVPDLGSGEQGFPLLTGAGRLVIKDTAILAGAVVVLSDSARRVLNQLEKVKLERPVTDMSLLVGVYMDVFQREQVFPARHNYL